LQDDVEIEIEDEQQQQQQMLLGHHHLWGEHLETCYDRLSGASDFEAALSRWWREEKAVQLIVSFDSKYSNGSSGGVLQQMLGREGEMVDFLSGERYLVIVTESHLEDFTREMREMAMVLEYEGKHKVPPEMLALLQVLQASNVTTSNPAIESFHVTSDMSLQIVSRDHNNNIDTDPLLDQPANKSAGSEEDKNMLLPLKAIDIQLKGEENQTLDFFSVAADQHDRLLISVSTPAAFDLHMDAMRQALGQVLASCCGSTSTNNIQEEENSANSACELQKARDEFELRYEAEERSEKRHLSFKIAVPRDKLGTVVASVSRLPFVNWIEPDLQARVYNHIASEVLQIGSKGDPASPIAETPYWSAGLNGQNQIVGVGDTGLDVNSCFFWDPDHDVGYDHAKVIGYRGYADYEDTSGHGTHVCGSIAGKAGEGKDRYSNYNGMAPEAKLAFTDLGLSYGDQRGLIAPETMEEYYEYAYGLGARLHSDSWGGLSTAYTRSAREVDEYHFYHPEFLALIAAGNDGEFLSSNMVESTVSTPATCKNALAVGATLSVGMMEPPVDPITNFEVVAPEAFLKRPFQVVSALFTPVFEFDTNDNVSVVMTDYPILCADLTSEEQQRVKDNVVLVERGECYFSDKIRRVARAGAKGAIVYNNEESGHGFYKMAPADQGIYIPLPSASVPLSTGRMLAEAIKSSGNQTAKIRFLSRSEEALPAFESVAEFSSFGPTIDGRFKPDVVAPGEEIKSASKSYSENECTTERISGTSMATPLVAGITAIVRQYLMDGHYPRGEKGSSEGETPTGALIKGIVINGASQLKGFAQSGLPLEATPSFRQGWGRVELDTALPLEDSGKELHFADWKNLESTGDFHHYCLRTPSDPNFNLSSISVTLTWMDAPGALSGGGYLVNDLDLDVSVPAGEAEVSWGAALHPDRINNVEKALVQYPKGDSIYHLTVTAHQIKWPMGNGRGQLYALVVFGPEGIQLSESCDDFEEDAALEEAEQYEIVISESPESSEPESEVAMVAGEGL
jgi:subtilisin family serine protease